MNENKEKDNGVLSKIKGGAKKSFNVVKEKVSHVKDGASNKLEQMKINEELNTMYRNSLTTYSLRGVSDTFGREKKVEAINFSDSKVLALPLDEANSNLVLKNSVLVSEDNRVIVISEVKLDEVYNHEIVFEGHKKMVACKLALYLYEGEEIKAKINYMAIIEGKLDNLYEELLKAKPKGFSKYKKNYENALNLFDSLKKTIIKGDKDSVIINKFKEEVVLYAPNIITLLNAVLDIEVL